MKIADQLCVDGAATVTFAFASAKCMFSGCTPHSNGLLV